ncbi:MAG: von Willebrand factor type A domain-containing protein [Clostridia bacterium]|nr:von Willebrand factor type A domain-containing protein [Clostridia bacterium]
MKKLLFTGIAVLAAASMCFTACNAGYDGNHGAPMPNLPSVGMPGEGDMEDASGAGDNYVYEDILEQGFSNVSENKSSYFSLDRNTATYSLVRGQIENNRRISPTSVRIEELINYFDYNFPAPEEGKSVSVSGYLADCPWNANNKLMLAGVKTTEYDLSEVNGNYVFLIDVSGSMSGDNRLGLAKKGVNLLLEQLGENDVVSIVTYASGVKTVLDGGECTPEGKAEIKSKIDGLIARGATNGGDGLERAYKIAQSHFITGGNNRVVIISDGDFNVGISSTDELKEFIQDKAESGVYLSVLGVGMNNMRDDMLETLATCGNGNYAYLDSEAEAEKVFVDEINGTLKTVAKDAKACVTFTDNVTEYRLIGYDTKLISEDEFENEQTDTGEIGSNLCVSALYEISLADAAVEGTVADIEVRYKDVTGEGEVPESCVYEVKTDSPSSEDLDFISCVAEFGLVLRNSKYKGTADLKKVLTRLDDLREYTSADKYKTEFVELVKKADQSGYYKPVELEISKIETSWQEGFGPFPRSFVRTFDFKKGNVTDTWVAETESDLKDLDETERNKYNNPKLITMFSQTKAQEFITQVKSLGLYNWKYSYESPDIVIDGGSQKITICFSDGTEKSTVIQIENPPKYKEVQSAFETYLGANMYLEW